MSIRRGMWMPVDIPLLRKPAQLPFLYQLHDFEEGNKLFYMDLFGR